MNLEHVGKSRVNFHIRSQYVCMYIVYILLDVNDVEHAPKGNIWSHFHELVSYGTCLQLHAITWLKNDCGGHIQSELDLQ